ncbi:hypothetical protein AAG906_025007 [Vitis piasezkii]
MFGSILEVTGTLMKPLGCRGSTCVEVMITLHGSIPSLRRHAEGCVTLHTISRDQVAVIPPIVTPVTIIEDPRSRMDRLEQRIKQMRDPDEIISWDDPDDVPVATLPIGFRMLDIERYMGVGCPRIHLKLYSIVMRALELEFLGQGSDESVSSFISRWREKTAEMIESLVQALFDVDDGISRGLWSDIPLSLDIEGKRVVGSSESYGGRPQISIPRHEQSRPHRRHRMIYFDLGMPLDRAFEQLRATGFLVPLAPRPFPGTLPPRFRAHEFCDLIDSGHFDIADLVGVFWDYFAMGFLAHLAPRALPILCLHSFDLIYIDIVDSGTFGHPQSDMFSIPTSAQAMHADTLSPAVLDLIDLGD